MKKLSILVLVLFQFSVTAQKYLKESNAIVEEGKELYKSEMASWLGTDIFLGSYQNLDNVGGYFSYTVDSISTCIFFSREDIPVVIGTINFDPSFHESKTVFNMKERAFTSLENDLYQIRSNAIDKMRSDNIFRIYDNSNLNVIPFIYQGEKKAYVLTGAEQHGVVIIGNDYLITFDKNNRVKSTKALHKNIIPIEYDPENPEEAETMHTHTKETGDYITVTDVCTLMLYAEYANWTTHRVVSDKYLNTWDCKTNSLSIVSMKVARKILDAQEGDVKKKGKGKTRKNK